MFIIKNIEINKIENILIDKFKFREISKWEYKSFNKDFDIEKSTYCKIYQLMNEEIIKSLLSKEEKEELEIVIDYLNSNNNIYPSSYEYKISTGKMIIIAVESKDDKYISGFIMNGIGDYLFKYLLDILGEDSVKEDNQLDEIIEDMKHFYPYGFKIR